ncbi:MULTISPECIES: aminotransferase class V-fold PLP-dependent enzyme [Veillonella]|uniref:aminotransferase class V-fold PLP-dependent enzyme n=1 Tax=Veillonella TaxID=29465 RepID=UPI001CB066BA|nr:aminotransferase class V-fold PLP-dependent enzyme [Veillonella sp.]MBF1758804.1 aminotransferase class V-fold PLP-dependent enzyme [Veillonella sp.]MDU3434212.1 aminotransferase class V-fold PLP-dependent enzyme [Veillonella sp.]
MNYIYLDNASTTFPKAPNVASAMADYITNCGININRGSYSLAYDVEDIIYTTRQRLHTLFNGHDPSHVIFTQNVTMSLNMVIKGLLKAGDHVLVSSMEHNAVMRPLTQLLDKGITFDTIPCDSTGSIQMDSIEPLIRPNTVALIINHASNVCGTIQPLESIGPICKAHNLQFIVDAAQTAGVIPIDVKACHIDALCFTGHKGLLGPQGIGGIILTKEMAQNLTPLIAGGTGSFSHLETMPTHMPDTFEAGTLNLPGIMGLNEGLSYIESQGMENIHNHELALTQAFLEGLQSIDGINIVGKQNIQDRTAVVSITIDGMDPASIAYELESTYYIMTRVGLHCAPRAHQTLGTYPEGTVRFSFGYANTLKDVESALSALNTIVKSAK